jgi:hypothetical protein
VVGLCSVKKINKKVKKNIVAKSVEVKTGCSNSKSIWQNLLRLAMAQKGLFYR